MALILILKTQGENRERGADGKLHATQQSWLKPAIAVDGHITWWGPRGSTVEKCKQSAEAVFGPLDWIGYPALLSVTKHLHGNPEVKAATLWKKS
jgi:hypothetical protein